jgi:hypothetical protein
MPPRVDGTSPAPLYDYPENQGDTYTVQGETNLDQVAAKLHLDPGALAQANPQIKDGKVQAFQTINLPRCSAPPQAEHSPALASQPAGHAMPRGPVSDTVTTSAMRASLTAAPAAAKSDLDPKVRQATTNDLIDQGAKVLSPVDLSRLAAALAALPPSEFARQAARIGDAFKTGNTQQVMYAVEVANAATHAIAIRGGGQAIQAHATEKKDGIYFDFDRQLSKEQAASIIFQGGKVPEGATLEKGAGNTWVVRTANDAESRQNVVNHYNSHTETVGFRPSSDPAFGPERDVTFTFVTGGAHEPPPVSHRKDIDNDFGFKVTKHYELDPGQSPVDQVKAGFGTGKGGGYEVVFDKPMTRDEVMAKLFEKGARFGKNDVQLTAVPHEPSNTWEVHIIGIDANTALKRQYVPAFADAVINTKASPRPDIPAGVQSWIDARKVPPDAIKHPPDVYTWEQDGRIVYVKTDGKSYYQGQVTKLSGDKTSDNTIRYFIMEKGMAPAEGWKAFNEHWDEIMREMIAAFAFTLAAAGGMPGRDPEAAEGAIAATRRPRIGGKMEGELDAEATGATRGTAHAPEAPATTGPKPVGAGEGPVHVPNEKTVVAPKTGGGGPLDDTAPAPGGPHDSTAPGNVKPSQQTADTSSPAPAPKATRDYDPKADPNNIINDKREVTINTPGGPKKMTRGEYYQRYENARKWLAEQRQGLNRPGDPGPRSWIKEAAEKFGLDENWYNINNPILYRPL